jgi:CubicO group peptidase (beta-lactamase class C family)
MQLWERKKINLDDKLITYLPYFKQQDPYYKDITIRQMLNHTSGIGDVDDYEWDKPQYDSGALERFVKSTAKDKMLFAPGNDWKYSNTAYEALGDLIAKVSGVSFETYVRRNILDPLDMNVTSFLYPEIPDALKVSGHQWAGQPRVSKHYPYNRMHGPSSTLNSNVVEMTHYAFAHLHRGRYKSKRILADATYDLLWTNSVNMEDKPRIGLSWWLNDRDGVKTISHAGGDTGFRSFFMLVPDKNISVMLVSNYEAIPTGNVGNAVLDILLNKKPEPVKRHIGFNFAEVMKAEGLDAAKAFVKKTREDSVQRNYYIWEEDDAAFAYPGYLYLEQKMYTEAIEIFKFNVEQFPNSGWAHSHLATGYAKSGNKELARHHYRKAIELLPNEKHFKEELKKLGG